MFNLEINFLKDRQLTEDAKSTSSKVTRAGFDLGEQTPLLIGVGVLVLGVATAGGFSWYINGQVEQSQKNIQQLDEKLKAFKANKAKVATLQQDLAKIKEETQAIVNVFSQVQSVSAMLQDLGDQMPRGMSLDSVEQVDLPASVDTGGVPVTQIKLSGLAKDFESVNDFLLTLKKSSFLNPEKTKIETAQLVTQESQFVRPKNLPKGSSWQQEKSTLTVKTPKEVITIKFPEQQVKYSISTVLNTIPGEKLIQELQEKGAAGLVTRLKTLKREGLIQP